LHWKFDVRECCRAVADVVKAKLSRPDHRSSDMNHYENDKITRVKDHKAIERFWL